MKSYNAQVVAIKAVQELSEENDLLKTELCIMGSEKYKLEGWC